MTTGYIDVVYTDFTKTFDKVTHKFLISKLKADKLHHDVIRWIDSFLTNRRHRVIVNVKFSNWAEVFSGVPQMHSVVMNDNACVCLVLGTLKL